MPTYIMHGSQIPGVFRICIQRRRSNDPVGKQSKADRCQPSKQMITRAYYKYTSTAWNQSLPMQQSRSQRYKFYWTLKTTILAFPLTSLMALRKCTVYAYNVECI